MAYDTDKQHPIVPREKLDFGLDDSIPKYWFGGDAFKTRFFDAMSLIFPPGEKFFMTCVRDFRDQINDPKLLQDIKDFNRQEAQHGMVHRQDNDRLRKQGIDVFLRTLADRMRAISKVTELVVPYDRGDVIAAVHREGEVVSTEDAGTGLRVRARLSEASAGRLREFVVAPGAGVTMGDHD